MHFIMNLIWEQSRSSYLAALAQLTVIDVTLAVLASASAVIFIAHALDAYRTN